MNIPFPSLVQTLPISQLYSSISFLLQFYCLFLLIPNFPLFCHLLYFHCSFLFWFFLLFLFFLLSLFFFSFLFFFLLLSLLPWLPLLWFPLLSTFLWTPCHLYFSHSPINLRVVESKLLHSQNYILLLFSDYINLCSLPVPLVIDVYLHHMFNRSLLVEGVIHIPHIYGFFYFLYFESLFSGELELITILVAPLSNNTSTITPSYISILSSSIFTVTSLNMFSLSRLQPDILSTTLLSIANLLLLEPNQGLLGSSPHLDSSLYSDYPHILFFSLGLQFPIVYNSIQDSQILYSYNSFSLYSHLLYKDFFLFLSPFSLILAGDS